VTEGTAMAPWNGPNEIGHCHLKAPLDIVDDRAAFFTKSQTDVSK